MDLCGRMTLLLMDKGLAEMDDLLCFKMEQLPISVGFILGLMLVGAWLERIGGKTCLVDELLAPFPMGLFGMMVIAGRVWA